MWFSQSRHLSSSLVQTSQCRPWAASSKCCAPVYLSLRRRVKELAFSLYMTVAIVTRLSSIFQSSASFCLSWFLFLLLWFEKKKKWNENYPDKSNLREEDFILVQCTACQRGGHSSKGWKGLMSLHPRPGRKSGGRADASIPLALSTLTVSFLTTKHEILTSPSFPSFWVFPHPLPVHSLASVHSQGNQDPTVINGANSWQAF